MSSKNLCCFVCDIAVSNRYFSLATCRTQSTKKKFVEKLGHLVGEKYMVVITEDDVICRSCANLMNTLDHLEVEMGSVRRVVLRFLERKYALEEGELLNQSTNGSATNDAEKQQSSTFMMRKKKADEEFNNDLDCNPEDPRSRIWMQCDKCQYTTNYTSFVNNHIRNELCLNCEAPLKNGVCSQDCEKEKEGDETSTSNQISKSDTETMELITSNMNVLNGDNDESLPMFPDESNNQEKLEVTLNVSESGEMSLNEEKVEEKEEKPALYLQVVDEDDEDDFSNVRQVLAVTGDGAVEMLEVMWNEETNSPVAEIPF